MTKEQELLLTLKQAAVHMKSLLPHLENKPLFQNYCYQMVLNVENVLDKLEVKNEPSC